MNTSSPRSKFGKLDEEVNTLTKILFVAVAILSFCMVALKGELTVCLSAQSQSSVLLLSVQCAMKLMFFTMIRICRAVVRLLGALRAAVFLHHSHLPTRESGRG